MEVRDALERSETYGTEDIVHCWLPAWWQIVYGAMQKLRNQPRIGYKWLGVIVMGEWTHLHERSGSRTNLHKAPPQYLQRDIALRTKRRIQPGKKIQALCARSILMDNSVEDDHLLISFAVRGCRETETAQARSCWTEAVWAGGMSPMISGALTSGAIPHWRRDLVLSADYYDMKPISSWLSGSGLALRCKRSRGVWRIFRNTDCRANPDGQWCTIRFS